MPLTGVTNLNAILRRLRWTCGLDRETALVAMCDFFYWRIGDEFHPYAKDAFVEAQIVWDAEFGGRVT